MRRCRLLLPLIAAGAVLGSATAATAAGPEIDRLPRQTYFEQSFIQCDGFSVDLAGSQIETFMAFRDQSGEVVRVIHHGRVRETFINASTGKTLTNRGVFTDVFTRVDGTDDFQHSVVGFDFMATQPGVGLVLQHVGRTVFSLDGEEIVFSSGQNNVPNPEDFEAAVCRALA